VANSHGLWRKEAAEINNQRTHRPRRLFSLYFADSPPHRRRLATLPRRSYNRFLRHRPSRAGGPLPVDGRHLGAGSFNCAPTSASGGRFHLHKRLHTVNCSWRASTTAPAILPALLAVATGTVWRGTPTRAFNLPLLHHHSDYHRVAGATYRGLCGSQPYLQFVVYPALLRSRVTW